MHQRRTIGAKFALGAVQPQHGLALAFRNRLPRPRAVDIFARGIDGLRAALGLLPIVLKLRIERSVTIFSPGSSASGSSTSTAATSALRGKSFDRRS